jgi:adenosylcobinamide kinase/adenosylcobinamide-phosphate guanylyltransferase
MHEAQDVNEEIDRLINVLSHNHPALFYIVSNEVGMGLVPETALGREYRDNLGYVNRRVAEIATDVYFMAAGIPIKIKGV